jgi:tellurite resistance protein TehA-like permease
LLRLDRGTKVRPDLRTLQEIETYPEANQGRCSMMNDMMPGMMWGMGLIWLLVLIVLILAAAALVKYLRSGAKAAGPQ